MELTPLGWRSFKSIACVSFSPYSVLFPIIQITGTSPEGNKEERNLFTDIYDKSLTAVTTYAEYPCYTHYIMQLIFCSCKK